MSQAEWSVRSRRQTLTDLERQTFDLIVIGGGITGAGIALDAASRNLQVLVVERHDFASGTSSRSSKLLHGGLRYLQQLHFGLVYEAIAHRNSLFRTAPHLAKELPFLFPVYRDYGDNLTVINTGLWLYDLFSFASAPRNTQWHQKFDRDETLVEQPGLRQDQLSGSIRYLDGLTHDSRLVIETAKAAADRGAKLINYAEVTGFIWKDGRIKGIKGWDRRDDRPFEAMAHRVVNAAGPWVDRINRMADGGYANRLQPTKGIHIIVPKLTEDQAIVVKSAHLQEGKRRWLFIIPYEGRSLVGTTDTPYEGPAQSDRYLDEDLYANPDEVTYLLDTVNAAFPDAKLQPSDIISTFAGWRPLIAPPTSRFASDISREHEIFEAPGGLITIAGGKLTTFQEMARQTVAFAMRRLKRDGVDLSGLRPLSADRLVLSGGAIADQKPTVYAALQRARYGSRLSELIDLWVPRYGRNTPLLLDLVTAEPGLAQPIPGLAGGADYRVAEIDYAVRWEMTISALDFICRRTKIFHLDVKQGAGCVEAVCDRMAALLTEWDLLDKAECGIWIRDNIAQFEAEWNRNRQGFTTVAQ